MLVNRRLDLHSLAGSLAHFSKETFFVLKDISFWRRSRNLELHRSIRRNNKLNICLYIHALIYLTMHSSDDRRKVHFVVAWMQ